MCVEFVAAVAAIKDHYRLHWWAENNILTTSYLAFFISYGFKINRSDVGKSVIMFSP